MTLPPAGDKSSGSTAHPNITGFFDEETNTISYVAADPMSAQCAIIDSVLDYDAASGRTATNSADKLISFIKDNALSVAWILETHVHADHLSAAPYLKEHLGGRIAIGKDITTVQSYFRDVFNEGEDFLTNGAQFDQLLADGERFQIGGLEGVAMHTPGHTPACMTFVIGDAAFVGDTLFMPDFGTARTDFPGGDARQLYRSIKRVLSLPPETRLFMCHDYKAPGRDEFRWETTVAAENAENIHVKDGVSEDEFVTMRESRDAQLGMPKLMLPSVQINMRAGDAPPPEENGKRYIKIPLNTL